MVTAFIVRHAQSVGNQFGLRQGHLDTPLSVTGLKEAEQLDLAIPPAVEKVYSSDLRRAAETVEYSPLSAVVPTETVPELREMDFGVFSGIATDITDDDLPYALDSHPTPEEQWPDGESTVEFTQRVESAIESVITQHDADATIGLVVHQGVLFALLDIANAVSPGSESYDDQENLSGYKFEIVSTDDGVCIEVIRPIDAPS